MISQHIRIYLDPPTLSFHWELDHVQWFGGLTHKQYRVVCTLPRTFQSLHSEIQSIACVCSSINSRGAQLLGWILSKAIAQWSFRDSPTTEHYGFRQFLCSSHRQIFGDKYKRHLVGKAAYLGSLLGKQFKPNISSDCCLTEMLILP